MSSGAVPLTAANDNEANTSGVQLMVTSHSQIDRQDLHSQQGRESSDEEVYDPETEGPYDQGKSLWNIPEVYEHKHSPEEEFRLIPRQEGGWCPERWKKFIPILYWLPKYKCKDWFISDLIAAITAIVMVIPQSMGYALVAGLWPIYGLYSALIGHSVYGPFGSSGQLICAPVAIVSLMTKEALMKYFAGADFNDPEVAVKMAAYGSALAFQSGVLCLGSGLLGAGILANMLAEPVIVGFTGAAAILIALSQFQFIFVIDPGGHNVVAELVNFTKNAGSSHMPSVWLSLCCVLFLLAVKWWKTKWTYAKFVPDALILVIVCTGLSSALGTGTGWDIVGELPKGLPSYVNFFDYLDDGDFMKLWVDSILITVLSFIESIAVATKLADKHHYSIDASQELNALGIANLVGCFFQIYPISGVLSLATVVEAAGALTPLYSCMAGVGMVGTIGFLLFLFEWLPKPVLGSIVMVAVFGLFDGHKMVEIYKVNKKDFICMMTTIIITLFVGIDWGVALGIASSIVLFIQKAASPHYGVLGRITLKDEDKGYDKAVVYRNVKHHPEAKSRSDMLMIRWDASIFFANVSIFKNRIRKQIGHHLELHDYPRRWCLALCFSGVNDVDYTGVEMLRNFFKELNERERGMTLVLCKVKPHVKHVMELGGVFEVVSEEYVLWELHQAEGWWNTRRLRESQAILADRTKLALSDKTNDFMSKKSKGGVSASQPLLDTSNIAINTKPGYGGKK